MWSSVVSDPLDEFAVDPDVISSGGEDFSAFVASRWPRLFRLASGLTGDRRGRGIRLRRAATVAGGLAIGAIIAAAALLAPAAPPRPGERPLPVTVPAGGTAGTGGVFASGTADGRPWRLAVQNIADPGHRCIPAITVNGTDADPVYPAPGNGASVAPRFAAPGIGFAFVQVAADVDRLVIDGSQGIPAIAATACGLSYRVVGFAYRLAQPPRITAVSARPGWPRTHRSTVSVASDWPSVYELSPPSASQTAGVWNNEGRTSAETAYGLLGSGRTWSMALTFGPGGACYQFSADVPRNPEMGTCAPIGTPDGPSIITAMPLSYPPAGLEAPTGYVVQVSPATARLRATASDGSTQLVTPRLVDGRSYAAFIVGPSLRLIRLTWLNAIGRPIASSTALPRAGYTQFRP
jgi:hypothetical protein